MNNTQIPSETMTELLGEVIYSYTRAQAIEDGVLIAIPQARSMGVKFPVAVTTAVWGIIDAAVSTGKRDLNGVIADICIMFKLKARTTNGGLLQFQVLIYSPSSRNDKLYTFKAVCDGGDNGEPVITIMLPNED